MDILALKGCLFPGPSSKIEYLNDRGFRSSNFPDDLHLYGNSVYFYNRGHETTLMATECKLNRSSLNTFEGERHSCSFSPSGELLATVIDHLRACASLVFSRRSFPAISERYTTFSSFWNEVPKPSNEIELSTFAYSKRGRQKQFVNIYDLHMKEITGKVDVPNGSVVSLCVRWVFYVRVTPDGPNFGFRPDFGSGVQVHELSGMCPAVRKPWDWSGLDFESLSMPMYPRFNVKCPPLTINSEFGGIIKVDLSEDDDFKRAMVKFHGNAGCSEWDGTIHLKTSKPVHVGDRVLLTVFCDRNKEGIHWHTDRLFQLPRPSPSQSPHIPTTALNEGKKRDADNMDNSPVSKTKRQCILHGNGVHMTE